MHRILGHGHEGLDGPPEYRHTLHIQITHIHAHRATPHTNNRLNNKITHTHLSFFIVEIFAHDCDCIKDCGEEITHVGDHCQHRGEGKFVPIAA